ncbi:BN159_2729 family protein [Streptomyces cinnabarinus]|uniref:BN159_2729 family protein n=1 Tax=Streptomyces cinnabarinus TaxID=67287 RepID=A0ABY7KIU8_9ACTN|nr:BN159_2729 family protein [Streptomyces cinnabarinus]WAZ24482.1 BN159_2729 family protein [Streptomyces cinnabarinus]
MNSNLPHVAGVIRAVLESVRPEQATAVAQALDTARLLVDPERTFGAVLHRGSDGGWSRTRPAATELERQALDWDAACARARSVAHTIERQLTEHQGPSGVRVDGDRVRVLLRVDGPAQWADWRAYLGITVVKEGNRPHTVVGEGEHGGVRVAVVARGAASTPGATTGRRQARPFRLGGTTYDLAVPQRDAHGDVWYFQGCRNHDGMPLMSVDGRPERCSLANVAAHLGPLTPVPQPEDTAAVPAPMTTLPTPPALPPAPVCGPTGPVG